MTTVFEIVCPDGRARHLPYTNLDDAMFDAKLCDDQDCKLYPDPAMHDNGPCPGGLHNVSPVSIMHGGIA